MVQDQQAAILEKGSRKKVVTSDYSYLILVAVCIIAWAGGPERRQQTRSWSSYPGKNKLVAACIGRGQRSWENQTGLHSVPEVALPGHGCELHVEREGGVKDESRFLAGE